ncbi:MAG: diphthine--ammonia ligase [Candidatus Nanoarchaeia archaeon]|nr:diphthine--ammonia ligase [Candidatus Haiyanarchaeum thermophilum]MCW1302787.1 diphthine--ammonia ligase [Candidatus Haiyanarchaeum thermophilum]MCW1304115.1 diphthine--ammonia ligase [Candidatus Haiyanarchaeum thermophilum]MCW1306648.1 diphthine--ammonia ligase [Candidatus Haiyanarchaeum thermophilum]MCW1307396.1 diphthine--ammonia ligase [Candidatus Haiyanarchaeum thermophilum]
MRRAIVLFSGGKDSCYSTYLAKSSGFKIAALVSVISRNPDSYMFHTVNIKFTRLQAEAMGLRWIPLKVSGEKEREVGELKEHLREVIRRLGAEAVVFGAIRSRYQKERIDSICSNLGVEPIAPLWGRVEEEVLLEELRSGMKVIITGVFAEGFTEAWLGRIMDERCVEELKRLAERFGINLGGEGGEYETFVIDAPFFNMRIELLKWDRIWEESCGKFIIREAVLSPK